LLSTLLPKMNVAHTVAKNGGKLENFAVLLEKGVEIFLISCENRGAGFIPSRLFTMKRSAFTLVELLVVIVTIALLVALLIPALYGARTAARTTQCISRQRDLALAMIAYNNDNNGLPGYLNELGTTPIHSWAVAVFPMIGENKRYEVLMSGESSPDSIAKSIVSISALLCPADNPKEDARLNYVVNCGPVEEGSINGDNAPALTLFKDRRSELTSINAKVKIEEIPDGMSNTVLLSENLDAGFWHRHRNMDINETVNWHYWTNSSSKDPQIPSGDCELQQQVLSSEYTRDKVSVNSLGFIWSSQKTPQYAPNVFTYTTPATYDPKPRPSSKHPGVVVAAYADGTAKKINDDISPDAWLDAVCPDDDRLPKP